MDLLLCRARKNSSILQATVIWESLDLEGQTICPGVVAKGRGSTEASLKCLSCTGTYIPWSRP